MSGKHVDREQIKALFAAVEQGRLRKVKELLKGGTSPNVKD